jgi:hypothetical protein
MICNFFLVKNLSGMVPVAHACNPSYSGGRDREDQRSKPALSKQFESPCLEKIPTTK